MTKQEFIKNQCETWKKADKQVIEYIANVLYHQGERGKDVIRKLYRAGYCYYFASMLKDAFKRGIICYAYYEGHIVWLDGNNEISDLAYDIDGVYKNFKHLIPIEKIGVGINDFMHIPGVHSGMEDNEIVSLLEKCIEEIENKAS